MLVSREIGSNASMRCFSLMLHNLKSTSTLKVVGSSLEKTSILLMLVTIEAIFGMFLNNKYVLVTDNLQKQKKQGFKLGI